MAIPFLNNLDITDNQLLNAKLHVTPTPPTAAAGQIYFDSTASPSSNLTAKYYSNGADQWVSLKEYFFPTGTYITGAVTGTTPKPIITFDLNAVDGTSAAGERYLTKTNKWAEISTIPGTYTWTVSDGSNSTPVASGETVTFSGTANEIEVAESSRTVTIGLPDDVTITNDLTVSGAGDFTGQVTIPILPVASTDAASKDYVDNAVVGGLVYQGGYDAATNTPDLTTSPNSILKGWTYTVTADGTFFGEQLRVGDVLIAEVNDPSALGDWTTVQNNIDLASLTQVGIGNVNAGAGISVSYTSGTATVTNTQTNSDNTYAVTISDTAIITHGLGTKDVIIQLYDVVTNETVYADIARVNISPFNAATITFSATPTNDVRVLVQKIG